jgi:PKD repeat protein
MKKIILFLSFAVATIIVVAQSVPREMVVVEDATGTWCTYCPGAQMGTDDLLANGKFVAVIANHNGDSYANVYSNARNTFYGISAFPAISFDGTRGYVGGNHSTSMYPTYLPKYNACIADSSAVELSMVITNSGLIYTAVITVTKVSTITAANLALHFVVTQSNIQQNWQGQTHLEHVNRLMVPNQNGTSVSFASGDVQTVTLTFTMNANWPLDDCEFITFLQNIDAGQGNQAGTSAPYTIKKYVILNAIKRGTIDLTPDFTVSDTSFLIGTPITFTNATTGGYIGTPETYEWIFPGGTPSTSFEKNPVVSYADAGYYNVTLIVNRGGQIDTLTKTAVVHANYPVGVQEHQIILSTRVSPNPTKGLISLDVFCGKTVTVNVSVINAIGVPVYRENGLSFTNHLKKSLDLSSLSKGVYFVVVEQEGSKTVQKVIIN